MRAVLARRRAAARTLSRLGLLALSFLLTAVTVLPFLAEESQALDPVVLQGVQSGTATLSPGFSSVSVPITAVDPARAFLVFGLEENSNSPENGEVTGRLSGGSTLVFERTGTGETVAIRWQVAAFQTGVRVQRGSMAMSSPTMSIPIAAVDTARSFPLVTVRNSGGEWAGADFIRGRLTGATSLELSINNVSSTPLVEWQVVEYSEASVQHGVVTLAEGSSGATVPVGAVDTQRAWLVTSYRANFVDIPSIGERLVRARVTSSTSIEFNRWVTSGSVDIAWSLVEFQDGTEVRHGSQHFNTGEAQRDVAISPVDTARSIAVAGYATTGGSSPYNSDDLPGVAFFTSQLVDGSTLRLRRGSTVDGADVGWFVVYWRGHPPVFQQDLGDRSDAEGAAVSIPSPATDPDGDTLTYSASGLPLGLSIDPATGTISGTVSYDAAAGSPYAVTVRVQDPGGLFATDSFTWTITNTNRAPEVVSPADRTDGEGTAVSLPVIGSDPDGDLLTWSATDLPPGLDIDPTTGVISGTILPTAVLGSPYAVVVRADDPGGLFGTAAFTWTVTGSGAPGGGNTYLIAGIGGAAGGDDLLTVMDRSDTDPATNETPVGTGTGTTTLYGLDQSPANGLLYASNGDRLGVVSAVTGFFAPLGGTFGSGLGPQGTIAFTAVHGIAFEPGSGLLYAVHNVVGGDDVLFRVDPATGARVTGAFGGDDYLVIQGDATKRDNYDIAFDPTSGLLYSLASESLAAGACRLSTVDLSTGIQTFRNGKLDPYDPMGLTFDAEGNAWGVGSPGSGGRVFLIDKGTGKPGYAIEVDDGGEYQAIEIIYLRPPVFDQDLGDRTDAEGVVVSLAAPATDPDGDPLTWSATGLPPGLAVDPATGLISGTITYDAAPGSPYAVEVRVADPGGLSATDTFTWTVTDTNRPPAFDGDLPDGADPEGAMISLPAPATDPDGDPLAWSASGLPADLAIDPDTGVISGTVSYDAAAGSPYVVELRVEDSGGLFDTDTLVWAVSNTNRPPAFDDPAADRADGEGSIVLLPMPATDPDGQALAWSASGLPPGLAIDPATGVISGTIAAGAAGASPYAVVVRVEDPGALFATASFTWTVGTAELSVTKASDAVGRVVPGQVITYTITVTNQGAATQRGITVDDAVPAGTSFVAGSASISGGLLPLYGDDFGARAYDGSNGSLDWSTLLWQEEGEADGALAGDLLVVTDYPFAPYALRMGGSAGLALARAADLSGHPAVTLLVDYRRQKVPADALLQVEASAAGLGGPWTVVGTLPAAGTDATYQTFSANVSAFAGASTAVRLHHAGSGLGPFQYYYVDDLQLAIPADGPAADPPVLVDGAVLGAGQTLTITFQVRVDDPLAEGQIANTVSVSSERQVVPVTATVVDASNRPPSAALPGAQASAEGEAVALTLSADDPDGDLLVWSAAGLPPGLGLDPATGVISGTVGYESAPGSPYSVLVQVRDTGGLTDTLTFPWAVVETNRPPSFDGDLVDRSESEGAAVSLPSPATDLDGDALTWSAAGLPPGLAIDPASGLISGTISYDASPASPYAVQIRVEDPGGLFDTDAFNWFVADTNRAPGFGAFPGDRSDAEGAGVSLLFPAGDPDGDPLTWSAAGLPPGLAIDPATGLVTGTVSYDASPASPYLVVVRVEDPGGLIAFDHLSWFVANTNRPPVVTDPGMQGSGEGQAVSLNLVGTDPDGNGLRWSATGLPPGTGIDPVSGTIAGIVTYDAAPGSPYAVTVRVVDDGVPALWDEVVITWVVADTNRAPVVFGLGDRADAEGQAVSFATSGADPDGDALRWSAAGLPAGVAIDPVSGVITGVLPYEASAGSPYGVTVTATDDGEPGLSGGVSFLWVVADTNRPPQVLHPGDRWAAEGDTVVLAAVGSDPDGDALAWSAAGLPPGLAVDAATGVVSGVLSYEAAATSPHLVTLTLSDAGVPALEDSTTFTWTVADTNRPPLVADPGPQQGAEGDAVLLDLAGSDPDGDTLTWSAAGLPPGLSLDPATGMVSGTIDYEAAATSPHVVALTVTDDGVPALASGASFIWSVADTNRAPELMAPAGRVSVEGEDVSLMPTGWDPDGDAITWSAAGLPPGLAIDAATGEIGGTLPFEAAGSYTVTLTVTDDGAPSLSSQAVFSWEVAGTNRAPDVIDPGERASFEGLAVELRMDGFDPDGDTLTWSAMGLPPGLAVDAATGVVSGSLGFDTAGSYRVSVVATDDGVPALAGMVTFTWEVADTNRAPVVVVPSDRTDPEGAAVALAVAGSDPDGDTLTWSAAGLPAGLAIDPDTGMISGTLGFGAGAGSPYQVTVAAADDGRPSLVAGGSFTWSIGEVDRAPVLGYLPDRQGQVGDGVAAALTAVDADGDTLAWSASGLPPGVSLHGSTGRLDGTLAGAGAFTVTVTVTAAGVGDTASFTWRVSAPGTPVLEPVANQSNLVGDEVSLALSGSHPDGEPLTFSATGLPPGLAVSRSAGVISGTPTAPGVFTVVVTAADPDGASAAATFLWIVEDVLDLPPEAQDDLVVVARGDLEDDGVVVVEVLGNDSDPEGAPLTLRGVSQPAEGEVTTVEGAVVFHPPAGWIGTATFTYRVADPAGQEDEARVTITVQESLDDLLAAASLQWRAPDPAGVAVPSLGGSGALLNSLVQSLHVLRVPLALLGGAVVWSLLLGGALNVGLALRRGLPAVLSRRGRLMAIVMAPQGAKVPAYRKAGSDEVVYQYLATDARIKATGRQARAEGREWLEVLTDDGAAWVEAVHLTEHLDRAFFAEDHSAWQALEEFVDGLRRRQPLTGLVSRHGLWVAYHAAPVHYPPERVAGLWDDPDVRVWKGRNPAYPDLQGTFDSAVAAGVIDAYDHPKMELAPDQAAVPSTAIPVEFTNLHFISIGADLIGPERLDQTAWLVHFSYEGGKPRVIGLCREG